MTTQYNRNVLGKMAPNLTWIVFQIFGELILKNNNFSKGFMCRQLVWRHRMTAFSIQNFSTILITQPYHILDSLISEQDLAYRYLPPPLQRFQSWFRTVPRFLRKGGGGQLTFLLISMKNMKTKVVQHVPLSIRLWSRKQ